MRLFKSQHLDLEAIIGNDDKINSFINMIHFKYVFIIGDPADFNKGQFSQLLKSILDKDMKPFSLFMQKLSTEIAETEYPHLCIKSDEKKKLALYPNIVVKCKDIGLETKKQNFQVMLCPSMKIKGE
jgi:hypothetical protein